jgi:hypothetical protein
MPNLTKGLDLLPDSPPRLGPLVPLTALTSLAGAAGMVCSFVYLASTNQLDVLAGAAGFVAGAILVAGGLISLSAQCLSLSPSGNELLTRMLRCLYAFLLPPALAIVAWPVFYFTFFVMGIILMPFMLVICAVLALWCSGVVAENVCAMLGWSAVRAIRAMYAVAFVMQLLAIAASWPLFRLLLNQLELMGFKGGWS